jgi:hypothetical protein
MKIFSLLFISLFIVSSVFSQSFEWAASVSGVQLDYSFSSIDKQNNIVVGGDANMLFDDNSDEVGIYDGKGIKLPEIPLDDKILIVSYSALGAINWCLTLNNENVELKGISHSIKGNTVLFLNVKGGYLDGNNAEYGNVSELYKGLIPKGYYLFTLDAKGKYISKVEILKGNEASIDFSAFKSSPQGDFIITGFVEPGKISNSINIQAGKAGGDLIFCLDELGKTKWADVIAYKSESCCSYFQNKCMPSIAKDGTIYFAGTFMNGGPYESNSKESNQDKTNGANQVYLISYSINGVRNWMKKSGTNSLFNALAVSEKGVYLSYILFKEDESFSNKVDTVGQKFSLISNFNFSGDILWTKSNRLHNVKSIVADHENNVYLTGETRVGNIIGNDTLQTYGNAYIGCFDSNGEYKWMKEADIPLETQNNPLFLHIDDCGNMYLIGTLFFSLQSEMMWWDKAFIKGTGYGSAPFISKFKNTLPTRETSVDVCQISPGPWKIKNFPNPFTDHTNIEFNLSYDDIISLQIYSSNGEEIKTLIDKKEYRKGIHQINFETSLPNGMYVLRLKGTAIWESCKIIVQH